MHTPSFSYGADLMASHPVSKPIQGNCALVSPKLAVDNRSHALTVQCVDPLEDPRWAKFVGWHPNASVFHSTAWLRALRHTYGYEPVALTTSALNGDLRGAVLFCSVRSWLTGSRLVSLPFSDHCEPLVNNQEELKLLSQSAEHMRKRQGGRYVEIRPKSMGFQSIGGFRQSSMFFHHSLDLRPSLDTLFQYFHKHCVQRKIRRSEREGLTYEIGRTKSLVRTFYELFKLTRQRHHLPAQPIQWFYNLIDSMGDNGCIRIASKAGRPVAAIFTLLHGKSVFYKYGGSNAEFHRFGGIQMLLWKTIQEAKQAGCEQLDMGRSGWHERGLIVFKDRWAAERVPLHYWRSPEKTISILTDDTRQHRYAKKVFSRLPLAALTLTGRLLYRHLG